MGIVTVAASIFTYKAAKSSAKSASILASIEKERFRSERRNYQVIVEVHLIDKQLFITLIVSNLSSRELFISAIRLDQNQKELDIVPYCISKANIVIRPFSSERFESKGDLDASAIEEGIFLIIKGIEDTKEINTNISLKKLENHQDKKENHVRSILNYTMPTSS